MDKALIIGASGLIGGYLYAEAGDKSKILGTFHNFPLPGMLKLELGGRREVEKLIFDFQPATVFLPAAFTNVDLAEEKPEECRKTNVDILGLLTQILKGSQTKLVYFSTDYIFNGNNGPYSENDEPDPLGVYGKSKLDGELLIKGSMDNYLIIRTTCVYGWERQEKNLIVSLIKKNKSGITVEAPVDQITTPTFAGHLARSTWELVGLDKTGIYNITDATLINRFDFALMAARVFELDAGLIKPVSTREMNRKAKRPLKGGLKTERLKGELKTEIPKAIHGLEAMKAEWKP